MWLKPGRWLSCSRFARAKPGNARFPWICFTAIFGSDYPLVLGANLTSISEERALQLLGRL